MPNELALQATNLEFSIGQIVVPIATPSISGAVTKIIPGKPENRYIVFIDGKTTMYYTSQLMAPEEPATAAEFVPLDTFHACLTALQLRHPGIVHLYSLHAARVNFIPYQFKPVLELIRSGISDLLLPGLRAVDTKGLTILHTCISMTLILVNLNGGLL